MKPLKVLFATPEATPFAKVGGLADVSGVLPGQLVKQGVDCRLIMPLYRRIRQQYGDQLEFVRWSMLHMGWRRMYSGLLKLVKDGVTYYFIDNEYYFGSDSIYGDYSFDIERYCFFQRAVLEALGMPMDFEPDIIHCNDWQTGLIPLLLQAHYWPYGYHNNVKTVYTIHNLKYQGIHGYEKISDLCDLSSEYLNDYGALKDGVPNFMKAGIVYSNWVTTVSPTYANEIQNSFYGEGLDDVLRGYSYKLSGILNGIDLVEYDPETDPLIYENYTLANWKEGKAANKAGLRTELALPTDDARPLIGMISRLVDQKGLDLVIRILEELLDYSVQVVILGTGDSFYENQLRGFSARRPNDMISLIRFSNDLAHKIYAASDIFLMPSIFEPCGLSQMISMRYGTLPVVRETGGLKDTVKPFNRFTGQGTGFSFSNINAHELLFTTKYAVDVWNQEPDAWAGLVRQTMQEDFSWDKSANEYIDVYQRVRHRDPNVDPAEYELPGPKQETKASKEAEPAAATRPVKVEQAKTEAKKPEAAEAKKPESSK